MNVWWCNQSQGWKDEFKAGVVCCSTETTQTKFREMVSEVRKGDIVVHYRKQAGIVAISRARGNPRKNDRRKSWLYSKYGEGWTFPTEYYQLEPPLARDD